MFPKRGQVPLSMFDARMFKISSYEITGWNPKRMRYLSLTNVLQWVTLINYNQVE